MRSLSLVLLLVLLGWIGVSHASIRSSTFRKFRERMERSKLPPGPVPTPPERNVTQPLDHFDPFSTDTLLQRYFWNDAHYTSGGPVFLYIEGEAALSEGSVYAGEHVELASKYGALLIAAEHRFYGMSYPSGGLTMDKIKFLSSEQALADLTTLYEHVMADFHLSPDTKWISFGGSYAGALSAWFRVKYPHLVYGAIASSPPVRAVVNFEEYNEVVAASLADTSVGGSQQCLDSVRSAFSTIKMLLDEGHTSQLASDFRSCQPLTLDADIAQLVGNLAGLFMGAVQYSSNVEMNISVVCNMYMTNGSYPYGNLAQLNADFLGQGNCLDNSYDNLLKQLNDTTPTGGIGMRQWYYQTCTEFGYFQTCDANTTCPFTARMTLDSNLDPCPRVYGVQDDLVYQRVQFTNSYYGADKPQGTRIVFVNGSLDPWHALSVLKSLSSSEPAIFIPGTSHCANMASSKPTDPPALQAARQQVDQIIATWLSDGKTSQGL